MFIREAWPIVENADANTQVRIKYRDRPGVSKTATSLTAEGSLGYVPTAVDARYVSAEMTIPAAADWDKAHSMKFDAIPTGMT